MPLNGNSKIRTCEMQKERSKGSNFFGPHPLHPSWVKFHCLRDHSQFQLPMCIMHISHEEVAIDALELRRLCGKSARKRQKMVQKSKIFTKIYYMLGLAILECTPLGDCDPLESTNLGVFYKKIDVFNYPSIFLLTMYP